VAGLSDGVLNRKERLVRTIRESVRMSGFTEVVSFSFMNSVDLDILSISENSDDQRRRHITLKNPLRQEECLMRTTLMPSLIRTFLYNHSRGSKDIRLFELSKVFIDWGKQLPNEGLRLAGIFFQDAAPALWKETVPSFYLAKGSLESLFDEVRLKEYSFVPSRERFLHPGRSADIYSSDEKIGFLGELAPQVTDLLDIKVQKPQVMVFEIDLDLLMTRLERKIAYRQIPRYPSVERDLALIIDERLSAADVLELFRSFPSEIIEKVELFDYYKGKNIPQDKKSLGIRIRYRSMDRTLTEAEVEAVSTALVGFVSARTGGVIRGSA
jgi:phenylalanyl-tRNA synthetase beta chain